MTDYTDLIARLRDPFKTSHQYELEAADALEAQARRIAELEAALKAVVDDATGYKHPGLNVRQVSFDAIDAARAAYRGVNG